jgi:hypothetical protein
LSAARQRLVRTMQLVGFGTIENLRISNRQPIWTDQVVVRRTIRLGTPAVPSPVDPASFTLKATVVELMELLDVLESGEIEALHIRHGLPTELTIRSTAEAGSSAFMVRDPNEGDRQLWRPSREHGDANRSEHVKGHGGQSIR